MSKYGLLQGLGQGMASAGDFMMRNKADELKEQRLRQYQMEAEARQNTRQDSIRAEDRTYQAELTAADQARDDAAKVVRQEESIDPKTGKLITVSYGKDKDGQEVILQQVEKVREAKEATAQWGVDKFGRQYNKMTGEIRGEPILGDGGPGSEVTSQQISAARAILSQFKDAYPDDISPQDQARIQHANNIISRAAGISLEDKQDIPVPTSYADAFAAFTSLNPGASESDINKAIQETFGFTPDTASPKPAPSSAHSSRQEPEDRPKPEKRYTGDPFTPFKEAGGLLKQGHGAAVDASSEFMSRSAAMTAYTKATRNGMAVKTVDTQTLTNVLPYLSGETAKEIAQELARRGAN